MVEEYTLSIHCPLGTMVGPGRYGMYWVARSHVLDHAMGTYKTVFRSAMPSDYPPILRAEHEPNSVAEAALRRKRGVLKDDGTTQPIG